MTFSDASLSDVIAKGACAIVVARIEEVSPDADIDEDTGAGTVRLTVLRELTTGRRRAGPEAFAGYKQHTSAGLRAKLGRRGWDGVEISPGAHVLAAVPAILDEKEAPSGPVAPLAVAPLTGPDDPFVEGVLRALKLDQAEGGVERVRLAREALVSPLPFLPGYAHYAIGRLHRIPREDAVTLEAVVLADAARPPGERARAQANLELELWKAGDPDDPTNKRVLQIFLNATAGGDPELRGPLVSALHAMLEGDEADQGEYRTKLMAGVQIANRPALLAALAGLAQDPNRGAEARWLSAFFGK